MVTMSFAQQKQACLAKPMAGRQQLASLRSFAKAPRGMTLVRASTAVAPPAKGDIKDKVAETSINGERCWWN